MRVLFENIRGKRHAKLELFPKNLYIWSPARSALTEEGYGTWNPGEANEHKSLIASVADYVREEFISTAGLGLSVTLSS